jgi:hypothetical protein
MAIHERVDNKLTHCYKQEFGEDLLLAPAFTYELSAGVVTALELAYTIDHPTPQRLENFRETCEYFYELRGFMVEDAVCRVLFRATDIFDMASLIHALNYQSVSVESILSVVDDSQTEKVTHDVAMPVDDDEDLGDDMPLFDAHEVGYSQDGKTLTGCRYTFNDIHYEVPDGVESIDDFAFLACRHYVELSIPRSVKTIGDCIFGNGGIIKIRDESPSISFLAEPVF